MALILCIETSGQTASVALISNGLSVAIRNNAVRHDHGSFLQPAIQEIMLESGRSLSDMDAIAVSIGPGSYTGLRVGLSSAKGICYALNKPLIEIGTLSIMAEMTQKKLSSLHKYDCFIVPMIDARRNEVFTATFDHELNIIHQPAALILEEDTFEELLSRPVYFTGDGSIKWQQQCTHTNAFFISLPLTAADMSSMAEKAYQNKQFTPADRGVPFYGKAFYSTEQKKR